MTDQTPQGNANSAAKEAKAEEKAAKAKAKALRPWFKKKRFIFPIVLLVIVGIYSISSGGNSSSNTNTSQNTSEQAGGGAEGTSGQSDAGKRDNPLPLGSTVMIGTRGAPEWEVTVGPATLNATDAVLAENQFNDPPEDGFQYALLNLTVTYVGETSGTPWFDINISYVGADAVTYRSSDSFAVAPSPFSDINELFPGGTGSGNVVIAIPGETAAEGTWRIGVSFGTDDIFFKAQ